VSASASGAGALALTNSLRSTAAMPVSADTHTVIACRGMPLRVLLAGGDTEGRRGEGAANAGRTLAFGCLLVCV
jgi:hypothetical protein